MKCTVCNATMTIVYDTLLLLQLIQQQQQRIVTLLLGIIIGYVYCYNNSSSNNSNNNNYYQKVSRKSSTSKKKSKPTEKVKVVQCTTPQELYQKLPFLKLDHLNNSNNTNNSHTNDNTDILNEYLHQIKSYSVNTHHKYFLNQLFGPSDDITVQCDAYLAENNTSVYTYETAPVLTLIEHEVIRYFLNLVDIRSNNYNADNYHDNDNHDSYWSENGDGIFVPGGSLSNLMGLHLARHHRHNLSPTLKDSNHNNSNNSNIVLVSTEAHYSFMKSANISKFDLICVSTDVYGRMDLEHLTHLCRKYGERVVLIGATSGSTVVGAFDDLNEIYNRVTNVYSNESSYSRDNSYRPWLHCDGAWGGNVIFSEKYKYLLNGVHNFDSFTLNAHKMLGATQQCTLFLTRHKKVLTDANSCGAEYLFSNRKIGASYDLGDKTFTCGRRGDALKYWALLKCHGPSKLGNRVNHSAYLIRFFLQLIITSVSDTNIDPSASKYRNNFLLACPPQPFNLNFYFIPSRLIPGILQCSKMKSISEMNQKIVNGGTVYFNKMIAKDIDEVQISLKLRLHKAGEVLLPYQPITCVVVDEAVDELLSSEEETFRQRSKEIIHCLRLVFAGMRDQESSHSSHTSYEDLLDLIDIIYQSGQGL